MSAENSIAQKPIISTLTTAISAASFAVPDPLFFVAAPISAPACVLTSVGGVKSALDNTRSKLSRAFGAAATLTGVGALAHFGYEATYVASIVDVMLSPLSTVVGMGVSGGFNILSYATRGGGGNAEPIQKAADPTDHLEP